MFKLNGLLVFYEGAAGPDNEAKGSLLLFLDVPPMIGSSSQPPKLVTGGLLPTPRDDPPKMLFILFEPPPRFRLEPNAPPNGSDYLVVYLLFENGSLVDGKRDVDVDEGLFVNESNKPDISLEFMLFNGFA